MSGRSILVTGASGFVGRAVLAALAEGNGAVRAAYRRAPDGAHRAVSIGDIGPDTDWRAALDGVDAVIHLAGLAHAAAAKDQLWRVNVEGVGRLAEQAESSGVRRLVFVSSVKAADEKSGAAPLHEAMPARPRTAYGCAKAEAEQIVLARPRLAPIVLRPPLVIGPGGKANAALLLRLADTALPLPFASVRARRNVIALAALARAIAAAAEDPAGATGIFFVADQPSLTLPDLIASLREGLDRAANLFPAPPVLLPAVVRTPLEVDDRAFRAAYPGVFRAEAPESLADAARAWKQARP